ncbi:unnamed protein product [Sympodiomycopsis kandeliae]
MVQLILTIALLTVFTLVVAKDAPLLRGNQELASRGQAPLRGYYYADTACSGGSQKEIRTANNPIILTDIGIDNALGVRMLAHYAFFSNDDCDKDQGDAPKDSCASYDEGAIVCLSQVG